MDRVSGRGVTVDALRSELQVQYAIRCDASLVITTTCVQQNKQMCEQIAAAMAALAREGVIHRDLAVR